MLERGSSPLASRRAFARRLAVSFGIGASIIATSLAIGMIGYHYIEDQPWLDAFLESAMILPGMGPVTTQFKTDAGKLFAGLFALYCGFAVVVATCIVFSPLVHRLLHRFHLHVDQRR